MRLTEIVLTDNNTKTIVKQYPQDAENAISGYPGELSQKWQLDQAKQESHSVQSDQPGEYN